MLSTHLAISLEMNRQTTCDYKGYLVLKREWAQIVNKEILKAFEKLKALKKGVYSQNSFFNTLDRGGRLENLLQEEEEIDIKDFFIPSNNEVKNTITIIKQKHEDEQIEFLTQRFEEEY